MEKDMGRTLFEEFSYRGILHNGMNEIWKALQKGEEVNTLYENESLDACFGISIQRKKDSIKIFGESEVVNEDRECFEFYEFSGKFSINPPYGQELQTLIELLTNNAVSVTQYYDKSDWEEHGYHEPFTEK